MENAHAIGFRVQRSINRATTTLTLSFGNMQYARIQSYNILDISQCNLIVQTEVQLIEQDPESYEKAHVVLCLNVTVEASVEHLFA